MFALALSAAFAAGASPPGLGPAAPTDAAPQDHPVPPAADLDRRVRELLEDLDDATVAAAAEVELRALGPMAAPAIARTALGGTAFADALAVLRTDGASARVALQLAVTAARAEIPVDADVETWRRVAHRRDLALRMVEDLVPFAPGGTGLCAPLRSDAASDRLRARCALSFETSPERLAAALTAESLGEVEVALEIVARRGEPAAAACAAALRTLWDQREELRQRAYDQADEDRVDASHLIGTLAEAVLAVLPDDERAAAACAEALGETTSVRRGLHLMDRLAGFGVGAAPAVDLLTHLCSAREDGICRAALDTLGRLGATASPALETIEYCAEHAVDPESRRLARIALTRVRAQEGLAGVVLGLVYDLEHPTRWRQAKAELQRLGAPAAALLFRALDAPEHRARRSTIVDALHALGEAASAEAIRFLAQPITSAGEDTPAPCVAVDLAADHPGPADAALSLPDGTAAAARQREGLRERLRVLSRLTNASPDGDLVAALRGGSPALVERAARVLGRRGGLSSAVVAALTDALARPDLDAPASTRAALAAGGTESVGAGAGAAEASIDGRPRTVVAELLCHRAPSPPPSAFDVLVQRLPLGPRLELVRRAPDLGWPPPTTAERLRPLLADQQGEDVQRAAAETLARLGPAAAAAGDDLRRIASTRCPRGLARAVAGALAAAGAADR